MSSWLRPSALQLARRLGELAARLRSGIWGLLGRCAGGQGARGGGERFGVLLRLEPACVEGEDEEADDDAGEAQAGEIVAVQHTRVAAEEVVPAEDRRGDGGELGHKARPAAARRAHRARVID